VLKVPSRRMETGFRSQPDCKAAWPRRKRTLLSFQGPSLRNGVKKAPTRARGLRTCGFPLAGNPPKTLRFHSIAGTFLHRPLGQPGKCSRGEAPVKWLR
jgi:hypothetical protein